jgi:hypothetical protein
MQWIFKQTNSENMLLMLISLASEKVFLWNRIKLKRSIEDLRNLWHLKYKKLY